MPEYDEPRRAPASEEPKEWKAEPHPVTLEPGEEVPFHIPRD